MLIMLLRGIFKADSYSIKKVAKNFNISEEMVRDVQLKLESLGYIEKRRKEVGCSSGYKSSSCACCGASKQNFNFLKLAEKDINALKRS